MQRKRLIRLFALATLLATVLVLAWFLLPDRDPIVRGKPESEWITNIVYSMPLSDAENKAQVQRWVDLGPDGLRMLARGLKPSRGYRYRKIYRRFASRLPSFVVDFLPSPPMDKSSPTRMCVISLLCRMDTNAWPEWRAATRALDDENNSVRQLAINFFTWREGNSVLLNHLSPRDKRMLLPRFLRGLEDASNSGLRNNAAIALRYYPEQKEVVAPALAKALADTEARVRLTVAESLTRLDTNAASRAGVVKELATLMLHPDDQIAGRAASALRNCRNDADEAVAALLKGLHSTNSLVSSSSIWALEAFPSHADSILPEMRKAAERKDNAGGYARRAVKNLESRQRR